MKKRKIDLVFKILLLEYTLTLFFKLNDLCKETKVSLKKLINLKILFKLSIIMIVTMLLSCDDKITDNLFQTWKHSHEEDEQGITVYRNSEYKFPPSRLREGFEINKDGGFQKYTIASNDVRKIKKGNWQKIDDNIIQLNFDDEETKPEKLEIIELSKEILKFKFIQ